MREPRQIRKEATISDRALCYHSYKCILWYFFMIGSDILAYIALYRKFRPIKFSEVVGQEHIERTLKNQIKNKRIAHAYLFSGGRGSGKTSTAKILARAVNCLNPQDGEPCNECEICKSALANSLVDITEMDAASNNGVDNIRDIREEVEFLPTLAKYRVYIIDEVHMLSTGAFNALLKTLEEPPEHVIFILATTEPQKIPATILSRCQRFDFKRLSNSTIIKRLEYICQNIGVKAEDNALRIISNLADGAMRDAISILDRCVTDGDEVITEEKVRMLAGIPKFEYLCDMTDALVCKDVNKALAVSKSIIDEGKDISVFLWELIKFQRDIVVYNLDSSFIRFTDEEKVKIEDIIKKQDKAYFLDLISKLSELQSSMKWAEERQIIFEAGIIKICMQGTKIELKDTVSSNNNLILNKDVSLDEINSTLTSKVLTILKESDKIRIQADLITAKIELKEDGIVHIIFNGKVPDASKENFQKEETKIAIKSAVTKALGKQVSVKYDNLNG